MRQIKALTLLVVPLLLALSFLGARTALAHSGSIEPMAIEITVAGITLDYGVSQNPLAITATDAVTGSLAITDVEAEDVGATSATITWITDADSDSSVNFGTATNALSSSATNPVTGTMHSVGLANLTPATQYFFEVQSTVDGIPTVDNNSEKFYSFITLEADLQRKGFVGKVVGDPVDDLGCPKTLWPLRPPML